jgi:hypothetical protein
MIKVIVQKWEESERGWGTRPDGYSIHRTEEERQKYVDAYWKEMPDRAPAEYSRPCGTPYEAEIEEAELDGGRIRFYIGDYPGDGGKDGWVKP